MKKILITLAFITFCISLFSQSQGFQYQTILRDATRQYLVDQEVDFRFSILEGSSVGPELYTEEHIAEKTNQFGLVNLIIGQGDTVDDFMNISWLDNNLFLQVEIRPKGENDYFIMGTSPLLTVPLAAYEINDFDRSPDNEIQVLSKSGNVIMLSDGGDITLNDDDPDNEIQEITRYGSEISISQGGGTISINDDDSDANNEIQTINKSGHTVSLSHAGGFFNLSSYMDSPWISTFSGIHYPYRATVGGGFEVLHSDGYALNRLTQTTSDAGYFATYGKGFSGKENFSVSNLADSDDHGYIALYGTEGWQENTLPKAGIFINANGYGVLFAQGPNGGQKNFVMPHPTQKEKQIWYASLEGPEAAAYERGTAQLINGEAFIPFSEHFEIVINPESMTVILTPLDANSKGIAVIEKSAKGFNVKELAEGTGNYSFDWEVKAVRNGHEDFEPIRNATDCLPEKPIVRR